MTEYSGLIVHTSAYLFVLCVCVCVCIQMVSSLFIKHSESVSQQRSNGRHSSTARRYQANTVSAKFQNSLQELLEKMERFEHSFNLWDNVETSNTLL